MAVRARHILVDGEVRRVHIDAVSEERIVGGLGDLRVDCVDEVDEVRGGELASAASGGCGEGGAALTDDAVDELLGGRVGVRTATAEDFGIHLVLDGLDSLGTRPVQEVRKVGRNLTGEREFSRDLGEATGLLFCGSAVSRTDCAALADVVGVVGEAALNPKHLALVLRHVLAVDAAEEHKTLLRVSVDLGVAHRAEDAARHCAGVQLDFHTGGSAFAFHHVGDGLLELIALDGFADSVGHGLLLALVFLHLLIDFVDAFVEVGDGSLHLVDGRLVSLRVSDGLLQRGLLALQCFDFSVEGFEFGFKFFFHFVGVLIVVDVIVFPFSPFKRRLRIGCAADKTDFVEVDVGQHSFDTAGPIFGVLGCFHAVADGELVECAVLNQRRGIPAEGSVAYLGAEAQTALVLAHFLNHAKHVVEVVLPAEFDALRVFAGEETLERSGVDDIPVGIHVAEVCAVAFDVEVGVGPLDFDFGADNRFVFHILVHRVMRLLQL